MAIYRGDGGAGDATNNITINQITELSSDAQAAAAAAASSATSASSSASAASTSATNAANSATAASTSETNAASSATSAASSATNAASSETNAAASETAAAASETAAGLSETAAAASETNAATSATNAATSATSASTSATSASSSASSASTSATNASTSETNAASSASAAATSATNAASSATSASNDAATATTKASEASTSASNAATSETNAAASESAAATSATNASTSETNAAASETAAASSASAAATSATNAATSASGAATSASNAATSASNAATSETNAATSETNAAASATAAAASAASAASSDYAVSSWFSTTNNASNWDTAYGWGDHASAGYVVADGAVVINESGANVDFRIESDTNVNAFFLEGSNGNVGIGTSSPFSPLHLSKTSSAPATSGNMSDNGITISNGLGGRAVQIGVDDASERSYIQAGYVNNTNVANHLSFLNGANESVRINSAGNVGIGTASPSTKLDVNGTVTADGIVGSSVFRISSVDATRGSIQISAPNSGTGGEIRSVTYGNNFYLDSDDTYKQGSTAIGGALIEMTAPNASYGGFYFKAKQDPDSGGDVATRMVINSSGNVGIGTTSPSTTLDVNGSVTASGDVTAYSDERLKENWKDLPEGFVESLAGVKSGTYNRIDLDGKQQVGVSAQSLQTVLPDAVIETNDTLTVNYGNAALASAIELAKKVVELEARIKELEGK